MIAPLTIALPTLFEGAQVDHTAGEDEPKALDLGLRLLRAISSSFSSSGAVVLFLRCLILALKDHYRFYDIVYLSKILLYRMIFRGVR